MREAHEETGLAVRAASKTVPARLGQARYVVLGYDLGDRVITEADAVGHPEILPEDRDAVRALRDALGVWKRYVVVDRPASAELLLAVRTGRRGAIGVGAPIGGPGRSNSPGRRSIGGDISSATDMLSVYEASGGSRSVVLWRGQRTAGLSDASPTLLEDFKADVERAAKHP